MGRKTGTATGLALLLAAGVAWAGGMPGGEENRGLSPIIIPWSVPYYYSAGNEQRDALLNFLSLYALTRNTSTNNVSDPGTWKVLPVKSGEVVRSALFGSGAEDNQQLIQNVWIGGEGNYKDKKGVTWQQNPYVAINDVLSQLGFSSAKNDPLLHHGAISPHYNHFHIDLRPPERVGLTKNLMAGDAATDQVAEDVLIANAQAWLDQVKADLNLAEGEVTMLILDLPNVPLQDAPVMIAQANQAQSGDATKTRTFGVCSPKPNFNYSLENVIEPLGSARDYLEAYENRLPPESASTVILQPPKHGVLRLVTEADRGILFGKTADPLDPNANLYAYLPDSNYVGKDTATIQVDFGNGLKVNVKYFFQAVNRGGLGDDWAGAYCSKRGVYWKINSILDANGNIVASSVDYPLLAAGTTSPTFDNAALPALLNTTGINSGVTVTTADLPGSSLGQTTGQSITLDTDAAGHGWYIDYTPYLNDEYLPTSNPYEWVAKEGSAAYGKMDLLSVLLHEYGHALGIEHSADAHDYMATTLAPGVRRLPSAEELALIAKLVGEIRANMETPLPGDPVDRNQPGLPLSGAGGRTAARARITRWGTLVVGEDGAGRDAGTQFAVAANPTLADPKLETGAGWETTGNVSHGNGAAILTEATDRQTRLNQVFIVGEHDRYLSFTVAGMSLDNPLGPDDAFEAALLDANSGASLLAGTGLTRNDAFLNLQANGTERAGQGVTSTRNPDGSHTYRVDLSGIAAGTAVNLSFDLIGFGPAASRVTVRDIRLGVPETRDDAVTAQEDTPIDIAALANDLDAGQPGFAPVVVAGPAHGTVDSNLATVRVSA